MTSIVLSPPLPPPPLLESLLLYILQSKRQVHQDRSDGDKVKKDTVESET